MDDSWQKFYNHYASILDLSVTDKLVLRPEVLAAYNALQLQRQTMAAVAVYAKCNWQATVISDTFAHVFGEDIYKEFLERCLLEDQRPPEIVIYAIDFPERLPHIGWYITLEDELKYRQEARKRLKVYPEHRPSFYFAQDKLYIAVAGNPDGRMIQYYLVNFIGPQYPLSYFCAFKPNCAGALGSFQIEYVWFLWEKGILKIAEGQRSCTL